MIEENNRDPTKSYTLEPNAFAFYTEEEIRQKYLTLIPSSDASLALAKGISSKRTVLRMMPFSMFSMDANPQIETGPAIDPLESERQVLE
jgi:hypothetical protein